MKTKLLTLLMLFGLFSPLSVYGDNVPTKGEWHDDYYRSVTPAPPTVSIDGNLLSIHFIDALDDLTVQVVNEQGAILYNEVVSGEAGECVSISLDQAGTGCFYLVLEHRLGQAYGLRAYIYFHLLRSWGDVIITTEPTLGSELDISHLDKAASPASEVMDLIKKDIDASEKAFGGDYSYKQGKCYWSKTATLMLKGEVYLWSGRQMGGGTGDYTVAKTALQDLQQNGNLKLQEKFTDVFSFNNKENSEMIFALHSGKEDDFMMWRDYNWRNNMVPQREYMAGYCDETGTPFLEIPGYNLQGLMRYQVKKDHYLKSFREGDTRLKGTLKAVYKKHEDGTLEYIAPIQYKFQGTTLEGSNERSWYDDYPIYRYADALLLLAEAKALLGEDPSTEINAVRERAYGSEYFNAHKNEVAYPNDKGSFYNDNPFEAGDENVMEAILKERLREFFFEGKRWYDLRRFGKDYVLKYTTAQESRLLWPINEGALTNNPALKQTPGY